MGPGEGDTGTFVTSHRAATVVEREAGRYWPSEAQEMLLRAALLCGTEAIDAWRAVRPQFAAVAGGRASRRLLPLLGANLRRLGLDDPLAVHWEAIHRETATKNRARFEAGRRFLAALAGAGIPTLVLKGAALVGEGYRDLGLRPMSDVDIAVPTAHVHPALQVLTRAGWSSSRPVTPGFIRMQHAAALREAGTSTSCDLHWHVYWECCGPHADDDLWAQSRSLDFEGVRTRALGPADQLLHLCMHASRRANRPQLLWIPDALMVLRAGGVEWSRLVAQAEGRRFVLRAGAMLTYLERRFAAPIPERVFRQLQALPVSRLERLEFWVGHRRQGILGELPSYWCNYRRLRDDGGVGGPLGFARYLQQMWGLPSLREVPGAAVRRVRTRVRALHPRRLDGSRRRGGR
jgi:hypothetical protein